MTLPGHNRNGLPEQQEPQPQQSQQSFVRRPSRDLTVTRVLTDDEEAAITYAIGTEEPFGNAVLKRELGESVVVHDGDLNPIVVITLLEYHCKGVRISFRAPEDVVVDRIEVFNRKLADWEKNQQGQ